MVMEKLAVIKDTHNKTITALSYNPMKHEILVGFEGSMTGNTILAEISNAFQATDKPGAPQSFSEASYVNLSCFLYRL